jgi:hypothetical protein
MDPAAELGGQTNAPLVKDNIRMVLHAFRDQNQDGLEDESEPYAISDAVRGGPAGGGSRRKGGSR